MAISDTIQSMYENVGEVYDTITNVTLPEHKNIENIPRTIRDSYLEIINNGINVIYDNWEKVTGEGTSLTLTPTEEAPMKIVLKGNTYQYSTSGKNKSLFGNNTGNGITFNKNKITMVNPTNYTGATTWNLKDDSTLSGKTFTLYAKVNGTIQNNYINFRVGKTGNNYAWLCKIDSAVQTTYKDYIYVNQITLGSNEVFAGAVVEVNGTPTANLEIDFMVVEGSYTSQTIGDYEPYTNGASPNPDYPQEIQVVSGDNSIEICGKNLFDGIWEEGQISSSTGENVAGNNVRRTKNYIPIQPNTIYTLSRSSNSNTIPLRFYDNQKNFVGSATGLNENTRVIFTSPSNAYYVRLVDWANGSTNVQLEKGEVETTYEPYTGTSYPINLPEGMELCKIGTYQDKIDKSTGKNLFNPSDYEEGYCYLSQVKTANANWGIFYLPCIANQKYTISGLKSQYSGTDIMQLDSNKNIVSRLLYRNSTTEATLTATQDGYIGISFVWNSGATYGSELGTIMLNKGTTALPYEPYGTSWYLKKEIGKVVLNENSNVLKYTGVDIGRYYISGITGLKGSASSPNAMSNYFNSAFSTSNGSIFVSSADSSINMINTAYNNDLAGFKTWLGTTTPSVYYVLTTPTYTLIEGELLNQLEAIKMSYEGQTNLSQTNNDLAFILNPTALEKV